MAHTYKRSDVMILFESPEEKQSGFLSGSMKVVGLYVVVTEDARVRV